MNKIFSIDGVQGNDIFCGETVLAIIDTLGDLYLYNDDEYLYKVKTDIKVKVVKFVDSNFYALSSDMNKILEFIFRKNEKFSLQNYVENIYGINRETVSRFNIIELPYYTNILFYTVESSNNFNLTKKLFHPLNINTKHDDNSFFNSLLESDREKTMSKFFNEDDSKIYPINVRKFTGGIETNTPSNSRIDRINSMLGKIFDSKLNQISRRKNSQENSPLVKFIELERMGQASEEKIRLRRFSNNNIDLSGIKLIPNDSFQTYTKFDSCRNIINYGNMTLSSKRNLKPWTIASESDTITSPRKLCDISNGTASHYIESTLIPEHVISYSYNSEQLKKDRGSNGSDELEQMINSNLVIINEHNCNIEEGTESKISHGSNGIILKDVYENNGKQNNDIPVSYFNTATDGEKVSPKINENLYTSSTFKRTDKKAEFNTYTHNTINLQIIKQFNNHQKYDKYEFSPNRSNDSSLTVSKSYNLSHSELPTNKLNPIKKNIKSPSHCSIIVNNGEDITECLSEFIDIPGKQSYVIETSQTLQDSNSREQISKAMSNKTFKISNVTKVDKAETKSLKYKKQNSSINTKPVFKIIETKKRQNTIDRYLTEENSHKAYQKCNSILSFRNVKESLIKPKVIKSDIISKVKAAATINDAKSHESDTHKKTNETIQKSIMKKSNTITSKIDLKVKSAVISKKTSSKNMTIVNKKHVILKSENPIKLNKFIIKDISSPKHNKTAKCSPRNDIYSPKKITKSSNVMRNKIITNLENFKLDNIKLKLENNFYTNTDLFSQEKVKI
jgi:hypothetical protein